MCVHVSSMYACIYVCMLYTHGVVSDRGSYLTKMNGLDGLHSQGISFRWLHAIDLQEPNAVKVVCEFEQYPSLL